MRQLFFAYMAGMFKTAGKGTFHTFLWDIGGYFDTSIAAAVLSAANEESAAHANVSHASGAPPQPIHQNVVVAKNNVQLLNETAQRYGYAVEYIPESTGEDHHPTWTITVRGSQLYPFVV